MLRHTKRERCIFWINCISSRSTKNINYEKSWRKGKGSNWWSVIWNKKKECYYKGSTFHKNLDWNASRSIRMPKVNTTLSTRHPRDSIVDLVEGTPLMEGTTKMSEKQIFLFHDSFVLIPITDEVNLYGRLPRVCCYLSIAARVMSNLSGLLVDNVLNLIILNHYLTLDDEENTLGSLPQKYSAIHSSIHPTARSSQSTRSQNEQLSFPIASAHQRAVKKTRWGEDQQIAKVEQDFHFGEADRCSRAIAR